jgi:hypothetical protein
VPACHGRGEAAIAGFDGKHGVGDLQLRFDMPTATPERLHGGAARYENALTRPHPDNLERAAGAQVKRLDAADG